MNGFVPIQAHWTDHPKRNQDWADTQLAILGPVKYAQEILCVAGETQLTIRVDGAIQKLPIEDVYMTDNIEILTPSGFQKFDGIVRNLKQTIKIKFTDHTYIRCTPNHLFSINNKWIEAKTVKPNSYINGKRVVSNTIDIIDYVYDPINVQNGNSYITNDLTSHNCSFVGSSHTLISGEKISQLPMKSGNLLVKDSNDYIQFEKPISGHSYVTIVDTARGKGLDYSVATIIDISVVPYNVVFMYRSNTISTMVFPEIILNSSMMYYNAFVLIENNDLGQQVADILYYELEYQNVYVSQQEEIKESGGTKTSPGLRTTKRTKSIGCEALKELIETDKLSVNSSVIIDELSTFIRSGTTFKADENKFDDTVMTLVLFAYLTTQNVFKDLFDYRLRDKLFEDQLKQIEEQMLPQGFFENGIHENENTTPLQSWGGISYVEAEDDNFIF